VKLFYLPRVYLKLLRRLFSPNYPSFCKICGRDVHDFIAPDDVWSKVEKRIKLGTVVCYDCFCSLCIKEGLPAYWYLSKDNK